MGSLRGVDALAVSPDGRNLYAAAYAADSLLTFRRSGSGRLRLQGCAADGGAAGCVAPPAGSLAGAGGVVVSPGGGDVYVSAGLGKSVSRFARARSGALSFAACTANAGADGCTDPGHDPLIGAAGLAVAPDGADIYAASFDAASVSRLQRAPDGTLPITGCFADDGNFGCSPTPGAVLEGAAGIAIDRRGRDLYVASLASGSLTQLRLARNGALTYRDCWAGLGANGCHRLPVDALLGASGIAISPDGKRIVVASQAGTVTSFSREPKSGKVRFLSCFGDDGEGGCRRPERDSLRQATGVALDGRDVYVASQGSDSITRLRLDRRGELAWISCLAPRRAVKRCATAPAAALDGAYAVAIRGRSLYVGAALAGSLSTLRLPARG